MYNNCSVIYTPGILRSFSNGKPPSLLEIKYFLLTVLWLIDKN